MRRRPRQPDAPKCSGEPRARGDMRDTGCGAMVCGIHTRKSHHAVPGRDECSREHLERHDRCKEEGRPWLVGPRALSAGTLEEGLVLNPVIAIFVVCPLIDR